MIRPDDFAAAPFHLREARVEDEPFRYRLFAETVGAEFMTMVGDENLLQMQYRAREMSYAMSFPGAEEKLICLPDGQLAGRLLIHLQQKTMRLLDIGLLQSYRGRGIGAAVLKNLQRECQSRGAQLELQVARTNRAVRLYLQMGFTMASQDAVYTQMRWQSARRLEEAG